MEVEIYWGSSSPCLFADSRKKMQQMVSRANVPRTMMPATRLTEPEQGELEWESRWEQWKLESDARWEKWKLESQQSDARWEKMMQQLRNMIFPKPSGEVAVVDKESNFASPVEEVDLQYEARRQQSKARYHERRADTDPQTFIPLPLVEGQRFISLESHDEEWNVQRSTAATDEHSDSHESHEKEGEPIGELLLSCNSTDHDPLEVALTPWQITEELELSMPLPLNWNSAKVNGINSKPYSLSFSNNSTSELSNIPDKHVVEQHCSVVEEKSILYVKDALVFSDHGQVKGIDLELEQYVAEFSEYKTFSQANKLKEAECLPSARQIATERELAVTVRNLTRLPVRIPKPMVKMKLMAQHDDDELFESNYGCESYFPFSGFAIKPTNGSSSSLFHGGVHSLYEIESHLEELKHLWPDFEVADENKLFGDLNLLRNFSKMYVRGEEKFPNDVQSYEAYANGGVLMNIEKYEAFDDRKKGYLGREGFNISGVRGRLRIQRENGSAFVGMQHGQRRVCPFLPSKCSFPAEAQEFIHDIVKDQHGC